MKLGPFLAAGAVLSALLFGLAKPALALDPLPDVYQGPGYISWVLPQDAKLWAMEKLMERLRDPDMKARREAMKEIGFEKIRVGRELFWPEIEQPIKVDTKWLGVDRRKEAIMTMPVRGRHAWVMILFRQDANDETYWRPFQFLKFDAEPVEGISVSYDDILGDEIFFVHVKHLAKDDIYGRRRVDSLFKFDEKQIRLTYQETDHFYRAGKFQGDPTRISQSLKFKGDQHLNRDIEVRTYPFMPDPEFEHYTDAQLTPRRVQHAKESFAWDPQNFSFYDPEAELAKLVRNPSPWVRREAARRLGEIMKTTHPQLEGAMLHDHDAYVRAQAALALANIGDPKALPAVKKVLKHYDEPENLQEAYQIALDKLSAAKSAKSASASADQVSEPKHKKHAAAAAQESLKPIAPEGPEMSSKK
jgi:hypothetical protein